jgi:hypothetical protein
MELEQVETFDTHSGQRDADRIIDHAPGHPPRSRDPFGERLDFGKPLNPVTGGELAPEVSDEVLGRALMIGEVPCGEAGIMIGEHLCNCPSGRDVAVSARDLPHPVQNAGDAEIRGELETARRG